MPVEASEAGIVLAHRNIEAGLFDGFFERAPSMIRLSLTRVVLATQVVAEGSPDQKSAARGRVRGQVPEGGRAPAYV
jgi:hypothetical protein